MKAITVAIPVLMALGLAFAAGEPNNGGKERNINSAPILAHEYKSAKYNFSIRYPADWEIVFTDVHEAPWVKPVGFGGPLGPGGRPGFTLLISAISTSATIESYMKKAQTDLKGIFGAIRLIRAEKREVNGYPAAWMEYTYRGGAMRELNISLVMGKDLHVLMQFICECPATRYDEYIAVFTEMVKSVRLTNDMLALPHVIFTGVQKCGACGKEFTQAETKHAFFDAKQKGFLVVCEKCRTKGN